MIGIIVENLKNIDLDELNNVCNNKIVIFTDCVLPPKEYRNLSFFTTCLAYDFKDCLVATCVESSLSILDMAMAKRKFLLVPPNLWVDQNVSYRTLLDVYNNDSLELLSMDQERTHIVSAFFKPPIVISNILDIEEMQNV